MVIQPYLAFSGECEEALNFYRSIFGGDISAFRYGGSPMECDAPPGWAEKIMHATYTSGDITLMGTDSWSAEPGANNARAQLAVGAADHDEGRHAFDALAAGGTVTMPYAKQFWGSSFGMLVDRFGIHWLVNAG